MSYFHDERLTPYFRKERGVTTWLNLMEAYWALVRDGMAPVDAESRIAPFESSLLPFTFRDVKQAMALRLRWHRRGRPISYVDAVSYHLARENGLRFLTGDSAFRGAPGVLFLKMT